jgi:hypothetical protein
MQPISEEMQLLLTVYYLVQLGESLCHHECMVKEFLQPVGPARDEWGAGTSL